MIIDETISDTTVLVSE